MPGALKSANGIMDPYAFFRFRKLGSQYLLTNESGEFVRLSLPEFGALRDGRLKKDFPKAFEALSRKNFVRSVLSQQQTSRRYAAKYFVGNGTGLHIVVLTLRCDQSCLYCHASAQCGGGAALDMPLAMADVLVDTILGSSADRINIEFQGGEPLLHFAGLKNIVIKAARKAASLKRLVTFSVVSNLAPLTEEMLRFFLRYKVQVCTSLDGPPSVHDRQRPRGDGRSSYQIVTHGLKRLRSRKDGKTTSALLTVTRHALPYYREIVDEYLKQGMKMIHLRPLNPLGAAAVKIKAIGYSAAEFLRFYRQAMEYILRLNRQGTFLAERTAGIFLTKILTLTDPRYLDIRSPCGAGIGQIVYNYNGDVYTCDEARMLGAVGDHSFKIGTLGSFSFKALARSSVVQSCCTASCLEVVPGCSECAYKPYCGVCPVLNHADSGNIFRTSPFGCAVRKGILDYLFKKLENPADREILIRWAGVAESKINIRGSVDGKSKED